MTQLKNCSVSVIIPYYNASNTIEASIKSVFKQILLPLEVIIVNDASNKDELSILLEILSRYENEKPKIHIQSLKINKGASFCRNVAIRSAVGKYLAFLDSDDVWHKQKLQIQYNFMECNHARLSGHGYIFNLNNDNFNEERSCFNKGVSHWSFTYTNPFFTPTVMARRDSFLLFDESFRIVDDYKCWLENFEKNKVFFLKNKLAGGFKYPIGATGLTGSVKEMHKSYILVLKNMYKENSISRSFYYLAVFLECAKYPLRIINLKIKGLI